MLTNCPLGKKEIPDCWKCEQFDRANNYICKITGEKKGNPAFAEGKLTCSRRTFKVKPHKVTRTAFCEHCGKKVQFFLDWMGCAWRTDKGIVTYRELEAHCPHCYREIYVSAVNDVNVYRREKAYAEKIPEQIAMPIVSGEAAKAIEKMMQMRPSEETERGKEILKEMFEGKENNMNELYSEDLC